MNRNSIRVALRSRWLYILANVKRLSAWSWIFVITAVVHFVTIVGGGIINIIHAACISPDPKYSAIVLTIVTVMCGSIMVFKENEFQFLGSIFTSIFLTFAMVFSLVEKIRRFSEASPKGSTFYPLWVFLFTTTLVILVICQIVYLAVGIPVFRSFGWKMFDVVGTNRMLIQCYKHYMIFVTLVKTDTALTVVSLTLGIGLFRYSTPITPIILAVGVVISIIMAPLTIKVAVCREVYSLQLFVLVWNLMAPAFYIFKIVDMLMHIDVWSTKFKEPPFTVPEYANCPDCWKVEQPYVNIMVIVVGFFAVLLRVFLLVMCVVVLVNFGKGLKEGLAKNAKSKAEKYSSYANESGQLEILLNDSGELVFRPAPEKK